MNENFTEYCLDFYGPNGIYPYGWTRNQIQLATQLYKVRLPELYPDQEFEGDSVDRERVRDLLIEITGGEEIY